MENVKYCSVEGCKKEHAAKGYCLMHYRRLKRHGTLEIVKKPKVADFKCKVEECQKLAKSLGFCGRHYHRNRKHGNPNAGRKFNGIGPSRYKNKRGYVQLTFPDGTWIQEHRLVMEQKLDRKLLPNENIHHINGVKDDNRIENLELWITSQPSGQRPEDLVKWAKEILELYGDKDE